MDLIYADKNRVELGVLQNGTLDLAFGADENNFRCTTALTEHCCNSGYYLYLEGTEYGGIVDTLDVDTESDTISYEGRTWHGILAGKILCPDTGEDYMVLSGEANAVLGLLIERMGLSDLFEASTEDSGITISSYRMNRYIDAYLGIRKMLDSVSAKLKLMYNGIRVIVSAAQRIDYSQDEEWDSSQIGFRVKKNSCPVNHMVCLGKGDLAEREVIHLYADQDGNISYTQTFTGQSEITNVYDNANAESADGLEQGGRERLQEAYDGANSVQVDFDSEEQEYDIGDIVGARETVTGVYVTRQIVKKIVTINRKGINIEHKVGE